MQVEPLYVALLLTCYRLGRWTGRAADTLVNAGELALLVTSFVVSLRALTQLRRAAPMCWFSRRERADCDALAPIPAHVLSASLSLLGGGVYSRCPGCRLGVGVGVAGVVSAPKLSAALIRACSTQVRARGLGQRRLQLALHRLVED